MHLVKTLSLGVLILITISTAIAFPSQPFKTFEQYVKYLQEQRFHGRSLLYHKICHGGQIWSHYKCRQKIKKPAFQQFDVLSLIQAIQKKYETKIVVLEENIESTTQEPTTTTVSQEDITDESIFITTTQEMIYEETTITSVYQEDITDESIYFTTEQPMELFNQFECEYCD